ncbi:MAG TPA: hypothetical protein VIF57_28005 [Polyangia bacterium]|jgi:hypothetical protein
MSSRRGTSLLDLLPQTTNLAGALPDSIVDRIGVLTILDHRALESDDAFFHHGTLQDPADALGFDTRHWALRIPGLTTGLPFRLVVQRGQAGSGTSQEGSYVGWVLDILVEDAEVDIPGLRQAELAGGQGTNALHLERTPSDSPVTFAFSGVVRIRGGGPNGTEVEVIDHPDPFDPGAPAGAVVRLNVRPPYFLLGELGFGIEDVLVDLSKTFTPGPVIARGHGEDWQGVSFKRFGLYLPKSMPIFNSLSLTTKDVIVGLPFGVQGELAVEWGKQFQGMVLGGVDFFQAGSPTALDKLTKSPTELEVTLPAPASDVLEASIDVKFTKPDNPAVDQEPVAVDWNASEGDQGGTEDIPTTISGVRVKVGDVFTFTIKIRPRNQPDADTSTLSRVTVTFVAAATAPGEPAAKIDVVLGNQTFRDVAEVRGTPANLDGIKFQTADTAGKWSLVAGGVERTGEGQTFQPDPLPIMGASPQTSTLTLDSHGHKRRLLLTLAPDAAVLIGHRVEDDSTGRVSTLVSSTTPLAVDKVLGTFNLNKFNADGDDATPVDPPSTIVLDANSTNVPVPKGLVSRVQVSGPVSATGNAPTIQNGPRRGVVLFFDFGKSDTPIGAQTIDDESAPAADRQPTGALPLVKAFGARESSWNDVLDKWVAALPTPAPAGRSFIVFGRTDDLWLLATSTGDNAAQNKDLAKKRAATGESLLLRALRNHNLDGTPITVTEQDPGTIPNTGVARLTSGRLALPAGSETSLDPQSPIYNENWSADGGTSNSGLHTSARDDDHRKPYRCVEIYAFDPGQTTPPALDPGAKNPVPILVPGPDGDPEKRAGSKTDSSPPINFRVRLRAKWDSPTVVGPGDWFPTLLEALADFETAPVTLPGTTAPGQTPKTATPVQLTTTSRQFWELIARLTHDARTGSTEVTASLALPEGKMRFESDVLVGALAFAPSLGALVDKTTGTSQDGAGVQFLKSAALILAGIAIAEFINPGGPPGQVDIERFELKYRWDSDSFLQATADYVCQVHVNVQSLGLTGESFKIRYKNVGLRFETDGAVGLEGISLVYDQVSVEIQDSGNWKINGTLGELLRVASARLGTGSVWIELKLEFALDLGVIRLDSATIRATVLPLEDASVELRGLAAHVDIPGVLAGSGSVTVGDGGELRAMLAVDVIPAKLSAYGALALDPPLAMVEVGVRFPVGIPLANTGLALWGLMGRFVANGERNINRDPAIDPVQRELIWFSSTPPQNKYNKHSGQYAIGFGAVIGTMPDGAFAFSAEGALCVEFPDIAVIFGVSAKGFSQRDDVSEGGDGPPDQSFSIVGMTVIDDSGVKIGLRGNYKIDKVLDLSVPVSASFPTARDSSWYIRVGTDNITPPTPDLGPSRAGEKVKMTLFPGSISQEGNGFLMFEEKGIFNLGGTGINLTGFSIGFGAGFVIDWSAGPFRLTAGVDFVVGVGTRPFLLAGSMSVHGELNLVVVSVTARGDLHFRVQDGGIALSGHFCGGIDCWLFSISGCVDITVVDSIPDTIPAPDSPIGGVTLCDHRAAIKASLKAGDGTGDLPVVWPDTLAVIQFGHYVQDGVDTNPSASFKIKIDEIGANPWSGSSELKYAFRADTVDLFKLNAGGNPANDADWTRQAGPFDAAWWFPTSHDAVITSGSSTQSSSEEGRELGLFWWHPAPWARWLNETGGQDSPGDPAKPWKNACDPSPAVTPACAFGIDAVAIDTLQARVASRPQTGAAFPVAFSAVVGLDSTFPVALLFSLANQLGIALGAPGVVPLSRTVTVDGIDFSQAWQLATFTRQGRFLLSLPTELAIAPELVQPELTVEVCADAGRDTGPTTIDLGGGVRTCDTFDAADATRVARMLPTDSGTLILPEAPTETVTSFNDGSRIGLVVPAHGLHADLPGVFKEVSLTGFAGPGLVVQALDATGTIVDDGVIEGPGPHTVTMTGAAIVRLRVVPLPAGSTGGGSPGSGPGGGLPPGGGLTGSTSTTGTNAGFCCCGPAPTPGSHDPGGLTGDPGRPNDPGTSGGTSGAGAGSPGRIVEICRVTAGLGVTIDPGILTPPPGRQLPVVVGVLATGEEVEFPATVLDVPPGQTPCQHVSYQAPDPSASWARIRIKAFDLGRIKVVSLCGISKDALERRAADQATRDSIVSTNATVSAPDPSAHRDRVVSLDADSVYQLRVRWQYQGWKAEKTGDPAPTSVGGTWSGGTTERFTFRTADWGAVAAATGAGLGDSPADGGAAFDERTFDARGLARFISYSQPTDATGSPFFVGDPLLFRFMVDHIVGLLAKYGATLKARVLRTDPPLGTLNGVPEHVPGTPHILDVAQTATETGDPTPSFPAEGRIADAATSSPCMGAPPRIGGSTLTVAANLDPAASYDFQLFALRDAEEVIVAHAQFRTSRYRDVAALVDALGFGVDSPNTTAPPDFILTGPMPALSTGVGDGAMDTALGQLGLDPWPVPARPRTTLIWQPPAIDGGPWILAAALLEAEEPIHREPLPSTAFTADALKLTPAPRMEPTSLAAVAMQGGQPAGTAFTFTKTIRNASGTRVLFFMDAPVPLVAGGVYQLQLAVAEPGGVKTGAVPVFDRPLARILEGL